jgi:hypothetical protein
MSDTPSPAQDPLREFLAAEKARPDPPSEVEQRVLSRLSHSLALPPDPPHPSDSPDQIDPSAGDLSGSPTAGTIGRLLARTSGRGLLTFLVGAAVGAAGYGAVDRLLRDPPPTVMSSPDAIEAPKPRPDASVDATFIVDIAKPMPTAEPHNRSVQPTTDRARDRGLAAERKLVEMARTSLARGRLDGAFAALRQHGRQFPHGQLAEERDSLLIQALAVKGESAQARSRAKRFFVQYPQSLFADVVEQALKSIP